MKKSLPLTLLISCVIISICFAGCVNQPVGLHQASKSNADTTETANNDAEKNVKILSLHDVTEKLKKGETVYYYEITEKGEEAFASLLCDPDRPRIIKRFASYEELQMLGNVPVSLFNPGSSIAAYITGVPVYIKEFDNGRYYAAALCDDKKPGIESEASAAETDENIKPVVFVLVEKGGYDISAKNPGASIVDADKTTVTVKEAMDALNAGHSVRFCDIKLPDNATTAASALIADPATGEQLRGKQGLIILDEFTAQEYEISSDGNALAAEIIINYKNDEEDTKILMYAYIPAEALDDCLKVNREKMSESEFINKYATQAAVYSITKYKNDRVIYYNDSIIENYTNKLKKNEQ